MTNDWNYELEKNKKITQNYEKFKITTPTDHKPKADT